MEREAPIRNHLCSAKNLEPSSRRLLDESVLVVKRAENRARNYEYGRAKNS